MSPTGDRGVFKNMTREESSARISASVASTALPDSTDAGFSEPFVTGAAYFRKPRRKRPSVAMDAEAKHLSVLMERYANGDEGVFDELYAAMAPRIYRFCRRLTSSTAEADDCFQETFLKLHRARATYCAGANALHWGFAIARSVYLSHRRYRRRRPEDSGMLHDAPDQVALLAADGASPEAQLLAEHMLDIVSLELAKMSEKNRTAYVLLKEEDLSAKAAAAVLGTTPDVVKQRAHRAYGQLRMALDAAGWREHGYTST